MICVDHVPRIDSSPRAIPTVTDAPSPAVPSPAGRSRWSDRAIAWTLFGVAFVLATLYVQVRPLERFARLDEEPRVGIHLALGHGFRTSLELAPDAEPTAWVPPGYPMISAAAFKLFGIDEAGRPSELALRALIELNAIAFGLLVVATFRLGQTLLSRPVGVIAAIFVIVHPLFLLRSNYFWHTYIALAALVWLIVAALRVQKAGPTLLKIGLLGAAFGLLVQLNGSFIFAAPFIIWLALRDVPFKRQLVPVAVSILGFGLMLMPWTIRNYVVFDKLMYVRRGAELEMWIGNLPGSNGWQDLTYHPSVYPPEHRKMVAMGEEKYFALSKQRFDENRQKEPGGYLRRCINRVFFLVIGPPNEIGSHVRLGGIGSMARVGSDAVTFLLGVCGFVLAWRLGYRALWMIPLSVASTLPYIISHMNYRFTMHIKLFLLMMIAFLIWAIYVRVKTGAFPRRDPALTA